MNKHTVTFTPSTNTSDDSFTLTDANGTVRAEGSIGFDGVVVEMTDGTLADAEIVRIVEEAESANMDDRLAAGRI